MAQQAEKTAELQDPEIRAELDRRARDDGKTVIKSGTGGKSLDAQERLAEGQWPFYVSSLFRRKKGGLSRTTESGKERADDDTGAVLIEPDDKMLKEAKKNLGRK
uniref:Uncharacterized protein n=1 Tax=Oryza barthii TaxID=65489 RepID=A0A0D3EJV6_9ORYZ